MTRPRLLAITPAALAVVAIAGCGGSSSSSNSDSSYISKVNAICTSTQAQESAITQPTSGSPADISAYLKKVLPIGQSSGDKIKAVTPPADKKALVDQANANQDQTVATVQQAISDADAGNATALKADEAKISTLQTQADSLANQVGVTSCVSSSGNSGSSTSTGSTTT